MNAFLHLIHAAGVAKACYDWYHSDSYSKQTDWLDAVRYWTAAERKHLKLYTEQF